LGDEGSMQMNVNHFELLLSELVMASLGRFPVGNTGGSDVNMFRRMSIPPSLGDVMRGKVEVKPGPHTSGD
jgi:hypothetical protein